VITDRPRVIALRTAPSVASAQTRPARLDVICTDVSPMNVLVTQRDPCWKVPLQLHAPLVGGRIGAARARFSLTRNRTGVAGVEKIARTPISLAPLWRVSSPAIRYGEAE